MDNDSLPKLVEVEFEDMIDVLEVRCNEGDVHYVVMDDAFLLNDTLSYWLGEMGEWKDYDELEITIKKTRMSQAEYDKLESAEEWM